MDLGNPLVSISSMVGLQAHVTTLCFLLGYVELNPDPYVCVAGTLLIVL